jgi:hypothetical protein
VIVRRVEERMRCPFCACEDVQIVRSVGRRIETGGEKRTRWYDCRCGASCKSEELRVGIARRSHTDVWTPPPGI